jgi:enoyl-CoA hydratase/carnithine racemase
LKAAALKLAHELAAKPPIAVAGVLRCVVGAGELSLNDAIAAERRAVLRCSASRDMAEGLASFIEKRTPVFTGT